MKKIFLPVIAVVFTLLSANAQEEGLILISAGDFANLVLGDNMKVILKPLEEGNTDLKFNRQAIEKLNLEISGDVLYINPRKSLHDQVIYVLVDKLQTVSLGFDTDLNTEGFLRMSKIDLYLEKGAKAKLRTTGKINAFPLGDFDIQTTSLQIPDYSANARPL
jgi:hypothetical protein